MLLGWEAQDTSAKVAVLSSAWVQAPLTAYVSTHGHVKATAVKQTKQQRVGPHLFKGTVIYV